MNITKQNNDYHYISYDFFFYRNRTIVTNSIHRNDTPVALGSLDCLGVENDIGFCKGDLDKSNCSDEIVNIDCSGILNTNKNITI